MPGKRGFSRGSSRVRSPRRLTAWSLGPGGDDLASLDQLSLSATGDSIFGSGVTPVVPALTVVRLRGVLRLNLTAADTGGSGFNYAVGIGIVSADAFTVGATAVPKPFTDADWPGWMWHHFGQLSTAVGALTTTNAHPALVTEIDSKAMRKLRLNEVLFGIIEAAELGTSVMTATLTSRVLVKLP